MLPAERGQTWLDGFANADGKVMQFSAVPTSSSKTNTSYSVESQISGRDCVGGIQIVITPLKAGRKGQSQDPDAGLV